MKFNSKGFTYDSNSKFNKSARRNARETVRYYDKQSNGDELVSEYGDGWQRAYVLPKALLDFWKAKAKKTPPN